jgi:hypothetical protein
MACKWPGWEPKMACKRQSMLLLSGGDGTKGEMEVDGKKIQRHKGGGGGGGASEMDEI